MHQELSRVPSDKHGDNRPCPARRSLAQRSGAPGGAARLRANVPTACRLHVARVAASSTRRKRMRGNLQCMRSTVRSTPGRGWSDERVCNRLPRLREKLRDDVNPNCVIVRSMPEASLCMTVLDIVSAIPA